MCELVRLVKRSETLPEVIFRLRLSCNYKESTLRSAPPHIRRGFIRYGKRNNGSPKKTLHITYNIAC